MMKGPVISSYPCYKATRLVCLIEVIDQLIVRNSTSVVVNYFMGFDLKMDYKVIMTRIVGVRHFI